MRSSRVLSNILPVSEKKRWELEVVQLHTQRPSSLILWTLLEFPICFSICSC